MVKGGWTVQKYVARESSLPPVSYYCDNNFSLTLTTWLLLELSRRRSSDLNQVFILTKTMIFAINAGV